MPRYTQKRDYQLGEYWLSKQSRSPAWCRTWFDGNSRQTRRVSLGTANFDEAKETLNEWYITNRTLKNEAPEKVTLASLFAPYYEQYACNLTSAYQSQLSLRYWLDFFQSATVAEATEISQQEKFHHWLKTERNISNATIHRIVNVGKAALNWSWKRGHLSSTPYILPVKVPAAPPKGRPLSIEEIETIISASKSQHLRDFVWVMLATAARPDAVLDLTFEQCDIESRIINLNPTGREQTNKYRPTVRMPEHLVHFIEEKQQSASTAHIISYKQKPVNSIRSAWRLMRTEASLDNQVQPYSLRHTMARWMRSQSVPA